MVLLCGGESYGQRHCEKFAIHRRLSVYLKGVNKVNTFFFLIFFCPITLVRNTSAEYFRIQVFNIEKKMQEHCEIHHEYCKNLYSFNHQINFLLLIKYTLGGKHSN